jgi:hypothetical protein
VIRRLTIAALLFLFALPAAAASEKNLDAWVERELIPGVRKQLTEHPRFKGETVMFVVFEDNAPAPVSNELALSLRDRLLDAALHTPGVVLGWQQGQGATPGLPQATDCARDNVHYYIGIETSKRLDGTYRVNVRALDLEDRSWVTGFGEKWGGKLTPVQRQAERNMQSDTTFLGARDVPFSAEQSDLLARYLAHEMTCELSRATSGNYVVAKTHAETSPDTLQGTAELVSNNLANHVTLEFTAKDVQSNATLSGKAHRIDGSLYQYWLTITPKDPNGELAPLSASAYVSLPDTVSPVIDPVPEVTAAISMPAGHRETLLGPLSVRKAQDTRRCRDCSILATDANADAIVFLLQHQPNYGLVRLADNACRRRTAAHVVTTGSPLEVPIPYVPIGSSDTRETKQWLLSPAAETYYAVAVADTRAARRLANHLDKLPLRCADGIRLGLKNQSLQRWLDHFATLAARNAGQFDWRAIEVRDVL